MNHTTIVNQTSRNVIAEIKGSEKPHEVRSSMISNDTPCMCYLAEIRHCFNYDCTCNSTCFQIVLFSGHLDSWDVGVGAMDDGGGVAISWEVLSVIKRLNLTPKRTMRAVFWTGEVIFINDVEITSAFKLSGGHDL